MERFDRPFRRCESAERAGLRASPNITLGRVLHAFVRMGCMTHEHLCHLTVSAQLRWLRFCEVFLSRNLLSQTSFRSGVQQQRPAGAEQLGPLAPRAVALAALRLPLLG